MSDAAAWRGVTLLVAAVLLIVGAAFVAARVLRARRHGFSVRLQLFFAISVTSLLTTGVIGLWVVDRLEMRAASLMTTHGRSSEALLALINDFWPQVAVVFAMLGLVAAGAAFFLGRGLATPLERLARSAEAIARGERHAVLPPPVGREVRRLTDEFESMRRALEDRHHIEQFVGNVSHELKNPVSAIRAATEVLLEGAAEDPEARARFLARISEASVRLDALLADLLALARLEARGLEPDTGLVALHEVVRSAVESIRERVESRGGRLSSRLTNVRVPGNARWLRRAVDNLLSNAARYSPTGEVIHVTLAVEGEEAVITVSDNGPGVAPALRERVFERFVTDRAHVGGTGLGLAIVRSVAELHGGGAALTETERGASFRLWVRSG